MPSTQAQLRLVGLVAFCSMASMRVCDPMLVTLAAEFQVSTGQASAVIAAYAVAYGLLQLVYGPLGDRLGKLRVIRSAALACAVLSALTAFAPSLSGLVWARAAVGAAAAGIIPLAMAWIGDQVAYAQRQETLARLLMATVTGMMVGQWWGGFAAEHLGWRSAFGVLSLLFLVASVLLWRNAVPAPPEPVAAFSLQAYLRATLRLLRVPRVRWVLAVAAAEGALAFGTLAFAPSRLVQHFGLSPANAGAVMVLYGVGGLVYAQLVRRWLRLLGEKGLALTGGALIAAGLLLLAWAQQPAWGAVACGVSGLGFYMLHNTLQTQATQMAPEARGAAVTLFASMLFFGQSLGVLLVGWSVDGDALAFSFTAAAAGVLLLGALVSRRVQGRQG